jgi:predicted nucleotidyltransferase
LSRDFVPTRDGLVDGSAEEVIDRAGRALVQAARTPARVLVFGSHARGDAGEHSDFDFLVIEREVDDRFGETAHLSRILGRLLIPADVIVVSEQYAQRWGAVKGRWRCFGDEDGY